MAWEPRKAQYTSQPEYLALAGLPPSSVPLVLCLVVTPRPDFKVYRGIGAAMAGKEGAAALEAMAAEKKKMSEKCITCAGEDLSKIGPCFPQGTCVCCCWDLEKERTLVPSPREATCRLCGTTYLCWSGAGASAINATASCG